MMEVLGHLTVTVETSTVRIGPTAQRDLALAHIDHLVTIGGSVAVPWCNGVSYCATCWVYPSASQATYQVRLNANVSVLLAAYHDAEHLE